MSLGLGSTWKLQDDLLLERSLINYVSAEAPFFPHKFTLTSSRDQDVAIVSFRGLSFNPLT